MSHMRLKVILGGIGLVVAVTLLAIAGAKEGWVYSMTVEDYLADSTRHSKRVRILGKVAEDNLVLNQTRTSAQFDLVGESEHLRVEYSGVIPDMFQPDHEVFVEGNLDEAGVFQADTLMTKCASKYESVDDGELPADHPDAESSG